MEEEAFRQNYLTGYQKLLEQARRDGNRLPLKTDVAAELLISPKTLKRNRDRYNLPWPPLPPQ